MGGPNGGVYGADKGQRGEKIEGHIVIEWQQQTSAAELMELAGWCSLPLSLCSRTRGYWRVLGNTTHFGRDRLLSSGRERTHAQTAEQSWGVNKILWSFGRRLFGYGHQEMKNFYQRVVYNHKNTLIKVRPRKRFVRLSAMFANC